MDLLGVIEEVKRSAEKQVAGDGPAHVELLANIQKLHNVALTPMERLWALRNQPYQLVALRMMQSMGVLTALCQSEEDVDADRLANMTGVDALLIVRGLRLLSAIGFVDEVGPKRYKSNDTTRHSLEEGNIGAVVYYTDIVLRVCSTVGPMIETSQFRQFPTGDAFNPHEQAFGVSNFIHMQQVPQYGQAFDSFMSARRMANWQRWYDICSISSQLSKRPSKSEDGAVLLLDIAGGRGHDVMTFYTDVGQHWPGRHIVQDQAHVVNELESEGIEFMAYNFLDVQPIIGARFYLLKHILHDWSDGISQGILQRTVAAMEVGYSTLFINDLVLPEEGVSVRSAQMDIAMMLLSAGIERTQQQWQRLLESAGLKIVEVWLADNLSEGNEAVIECEKVQG